MNNLKLVQQGKKKKKKTPLSFEHVILFVDELKFSLCLK